MIPLLILLPLCLLSSDLDLLYDDSEVAIIEVMLDPEAVVYMYENVHSDSMHLATVHFTNAYIDETIEDVGFRLRGNTSRNSQKKSFKVSFNTFVPGRKFYNVEKLNLNGEHNDPSIMRSKISWDLYQKVNIPTTRAAHCAVYINDVYYGLYISVEHIDDEFIQNHFEDDTGNLWKCLWPADLTYRGPNPEDYHPYQSDTHPYELKTNTEAYDYSALARFIDVINNTPASSFADSLEQVLVVPDVLKYAAMNVLTGNWDDYWFLRNNYYLYHEPAVDRFHWIPYDNDNSFGIDWFGVDWTQVDPYSFLTIEDTQGGASGPRPLMENIMANPQYHNLYTHILNYYVENITSLELWESRLDSLKDIVTPWAEADTHRSLDYGFSIPDFHQSFSPNPYSNQHVKNGIKEFVNLRHASIAGQLEWQTASPIIYDIEYWPLIPGPNDSIYVSVAAFSHVGLDSLTIAYHPGVLTVVLDYPMDFRPVLNPKSVEEADRWIGVIPPLGALGQGRFQVGAVDNIGNSMIYPRNEFIHIQVPQSATSPLRINEFLASNNQTNQDDAGEYDDWLEIYNPSPDDLYLSGMYLTDNPSNLTKWMFPFGGVMLEAGGHLLVWCDEDQEQTGIHTNFKLSASGEFVAIVDTDGETIIDALNFGTQQSDISYGRIPDGMNEWAFFEAPTPGANNSTSNTTDPVLNPSGFTLNNYPNPFNAETMIRYTLPGDGIVSVMIVDLNGREIQQLILKSQVKGSYQLTWNALDNSGNVVPAGIYFIRMQQNHQSMTRKVLLVK